MLDRLGQSFTEDAIWKCGEERGVSDHEARLVESSDEVLSKRAIDPRLSSDGAVHLSDDGARKLNHWDTPVVDRGDESCEIANDPSAKCEDRTLAVESLLDQAVAESCGNAHRLGGFPCGNDQQAGIKTSSLQRSDQGLCVQGSDHIVGDHRTAAGGDCFGGEFAGTRDDTLSDQDLVRGVLE